MPEDHTISWSVQPHKKSVNLGLFKHPGQHQQAGLTPHLSAAAGSAPPSPNPDAEQLTSVAEKLTRIGLKQVLWQGKCEADKTTRGSYNVSRNEGGDYAVVLDNTFSKQMSKTATMVLLTYQTKYPPKFGASVHPAHAPKLEFQAALGQKDGQGMRREIPALPSPVKGVKLPSFESPPSPEMAPPSSITRHTGVLLKRRRKRHQGHARRFFSLDMTTSTLSYYHDQKSTALRGAIPLALAAIGANAKTREISIDSGAEVWHLRASSQGEFVTWKNALERACRLVATNKSQNTGLAVDTVISQSPSTAEPVDEGNWLRAESLLSRITSTRESLRKMCSEEETLRATTPSNPPSSASSHVDANTEDYFKQETRRSFWKRKATGANPSPSSRFRRSVSHQLAVQSPTSDPNAPTGMPGGYFGASAETLNHSHHSGETNITDRCQSMIQDLDLTISEFSALLADIKHPRTLPHSAASRLSTNSVDSYQEFFDAEDRPVASIYDISDASDDEQSTETADPARDESDLSTDAEDEAQFDKAGRRLRTNSLTSFFPPKAKSLAPLPMKSVQRRTQVLAPTAMPPSLISFLRKNMGKDLSTISMPVSANEPTSLLQRAAEQLEYSSLLNKAAKATDRTERLIYVTAFAISTLSNVRVKERTIRKPFNPMLGETYELVREDMGFRFLAEKVSHRPVQLAIHAESQDWSFAQSPLPSQKFWGKSVEVMTDGKARVVLHAHGECFSWSSATSWLRNVIAGEKYVEPVGSMVVVNEMAGLKAHVTFKAKGMFSGRSEEVAVETFGTHGEPLPLGLQGSWVNRLRLTENGKVRDTVIWQAGPLVDNAPKHYGLTKFAASLNEIGEVEHGKLPPTDSRFRPDQRAIEEGDNEQAEGLKARLEEAQRKRRAELESAQQEWEPRWFTKSQLGDEVVWKLRTGKEGYWEERARGSWSKVVPVLQI